VIDLLLAVSFVGVSLVEPGVVLCVPRLRHDLLPLLGCVE
jgi:hypothetical protein